MCALGRDCARGKLVFLARCSVPSTWLYYATLSVSLRLQHDCPHAVEDIDSIAVVQEDMHFLCSLGHALGLYFFTQKRSAYPGSGPPALSMLFIII